MAYSSAEGSARGQPAREDLPKGGVVCTSCCCPLTKERLFSCPRRNKNNSEKKEGVTRSGSQDWWIRHSPSIKLCIGSREPGEHGGERPRAGSRGSEASKSRGSYGRLCAVRKRRAVGLKVVHPFRSRFSLDLHLPSSPPRQDLIITAADLRSGVARG